MFKKMKTDFQVGSMFKKMYQMVKKAYQMIM